MESIRIATRSSPLAVGQARHVAERLEAAHDGLSCELVEMTTEGDRFLAGEAARFFEDPVVDVESRLPRFCSMRL